MALGPSTLSQPCASSWPFVALPAPDDGPRGIRELIPSALGEADVDGIFLGEDVMRDVALTRTAALKSAFGIQLARATEARGGTVGRCEAPALRRARDD